MERIRLSKIGQIKCGVPESNGKKYVVKQVHNTYR